MLSDADVGHNINLILDNPYGCGEAIPVSGMDLNNYCTAGNYKGNVISTLALGNFDEEKSVKIEEADIVSEFKLKVFPNPFLDRIEIEYQLEEPGNFKIKLENTMGTLFQEEHYENLEPGTIYFDTEGHDLPPGMYLLTISTQQRSESHKLIKQ